MRAASILAAFLCLAGSAFGEEVRAPTPRHVIYPGDVIAEDMLADAPLIAPGTAGPLALAAEDVVGMMATRTLLPGAAIPLSALSPPRLVRAGAAVKMIYVDGGLSITATGDALQDGVVGQTVRLRNADSGVTVSGRVRADGSVQVGGG